MSIPYIPQKSTTSFYVPKTLADDFKTFLQNDIPGSVMGFKVIKDWYEQFKPGYQPLIERGEIYEDSTKSRYSTTDLNMNVRFAVDSSIRKGDIIEDPNGVLYLLDWDVPSSHNNRASRAAKCNCYITVQRYHQEVVDDFGFLLEQEEYVDIAKDIPAKVYRYDGRPQYSSVSNAPGVVANALTEVSLQYNSKTKDIRVNDEFAWGPDTYVVIDVSYVDMDISQTFGCLKIQAKKKAGGAIGNEQ